MQVTYWLVILLGVYQVTPEVILHPSSLDIGSGLREGRRLDLRVKEEEEEEGKILTKEEEEGRKEEEEEYAIRKKGKERRRKEIWISLASSSSSSSSLSQEEKKNENSGGKFDNKVTGAANLSLSIRSNLETVILDLQVNRELLQSAFSGRPSDKKIWCDYQGHLREDVTSLVAVSVCDGVRGVILTKGRWLEVYPAPGTNTLGGPHFLAEHQPMETQSCGVKGEGYRRHQLLQKEGEGVLRRVERALRDKLWTQSNTSYVELAVAVDYSLYKALSSKLSAQQTLDQLPLAAMTSRVQGITNVVNMIYRPLGIIIVLTHVDVWESVDKVEVVDGDSNKTLNHFNKYWVDLRSSRPELDNAQLLTGVKFEDQTVGKALLGTMCGGGSVGINMDNPDKSYLETALIIAHEMGHNFGLNHIDEVEGCECKDNHCVMMSKVSGKEWDDCTKKNMSRALPSLFLECLRNVPSVVAEWDGKTNCGNGIWEEGEECDCGPKDLCRNPCCDADSCTLGKNATCASGPCCDVKTCHPYKSSFKVCREAVSECDSPEYCDGVTEDCGSDTWYRDGTYCEFGEAFCYKGRCGSLKDRCVQVWGEAATPCKPEEYLIVNTQGKSHGNCGYKDEERKDLLACEEWDARCGTLLCQTPESAKPGHFFHAGEWIREETCRMILPDKNYSESVWLVPDGAPCDNGKMCINKRCVKPPLALATIIFIVSVVIATVLTFLLWDHIRYLWEHRGGKIFCVRHFYYCGACLDATCCPCMNKINRLLISVLPDLKCRVCAAKPRQGTDRTYIGTQVTQVEGTNAIEGSGHVDVSWNGRLELKPTWGVTFAPLPSQNTPTPQPNPNTEIPISAVPLLNVSSVHPSPSPSPSPSPTILPARPAPPPPRPDPNHGQPRNPPSVPPRPDPQLTHALKPPVPPRP